MRSPARTGWAGYDLRMSPALRWVAPAPRVLEHHTTATPDGWSLSLIRVVRPGAPPGPPVLFVPGYGMNAWVVQYHPTGPSFADVLLDAGFDPWGVDLRGTSTARRTRSSAPVARFEDMAALDLPAAIAHLRRVTGAPRVHAIGCSLGGSLLYGHVALAADHGIDRLVAIASPLTWDRSLARRAMALLLDTVGQVPVKGARHLARMALPLAARAIPGALSLYLNPRITDVSDAAALCRTVEDPMPAVHRALARWMVSELRVGSRPVAPGLKHFDRPLLVLYGSGDGIVPQGPALSVVGATSGPVEVRKVEDPGGQPVGHADLFISDLAPELVFRPTARFLSS